MWILQWVFATDKRSRYRWFWMKPIISRRKDLWPIISRRKDIWPIISRRKDPLANHNPPWRLFGQSDILINGKGMRRAYSSLAGNRYNISTQYIRRLIMFQSPAVPPIHLCFSHIPPRSWSHCIFDSSIYTYMAGDRSSHWSNGPIRHRIPLFPTTFRSGGSVIDHHPKWCHSARDAGCL